jgi:prepilin peptidase CpaA
MILVLTLGAVALLLAAAGTDIVSRRIPNRLVLALALLGMVRILHDMIAADAVATAMLGALADLAVASAVFAAGAVLFHLRALGGGDVKLIAAASLFVGAAAVPTLLLLTALAGGALALVCLVGFAAVGLGALRPGLPYGVAIAAGGIATAVVGAL